jgi:hypothetical protein
MSAPTASPASSGRAPRTQADTAYRRAWLCLLLYPVTFVLAFAIGEGLVTLQTDDARDPTFLEGLLAVVPALLVFVVPGVLAAWQGCRAVRLGRRDGSAPALIGAVLGLGFVALNLASYVLGLLLG